MEWYLTKTDIARAFKVTTRTIERWIEKGELPAAEIEIGNRKRWNLTLFNDWLSKSDDYSKIYIKHYPHTRLRKIVRGTFVLEFRGE